MSEIADYIKIGFVLGIPLLLGIMGAVRHSLTGYLCGAVGLVFAIPVLDDTFGLVIVIPASLFIVGLAGSAVRDALGDGMNIV